MEDNTEIKDRVVELLTEYMSVPESDLSLKITYLNKAISSLNHQGNTLVAHGIVEREIRRFDNCDSLEMAVLLNSMIKLSALVGDFAGAVEYSRRAQTICREKEEEGLLTRVLINTSGIYFKMKEYDKAFSNANKALQMARKNGDETNTACCLNNIAVILENSETDKSGIPYLEEAILIKEKNNMKDELPNSYLNLAELYYNSGKKKEASELLQRATTMARENGDERALTETMKYRARFLKAEDELFSALELLTGVSEYHQKNGNNTELLDILNEISSIHELMGNANEALQTFKLITELNRTIFKEEQARSLAQLESSFEARENLREMHSLLEQNSELRRVNEEISEKNNELHDMKRRLEKTNKLLERQAETDSLTGLLNHRKMRTTVENEIARAERYGTPLTMIMIDLDNFKFVNDSYGHLKGDEVLSEIGRIIKSSIRKNDFAFRYGGEEFLVLLPLADLDKATEVYSRLKESFREELEITVSFSAGAREWNGESADKYIAVVDKLLYEAKTKGKDRLETSQATS